AVGVEDLLAARVVGGKAGGQLAAVLQVQQQTRHEARHPLGTGQGGEAGRRPPRGGVGRGYAGRPFRLRQSAATPGGAEEKAAGAAFGTCIEIIETRASYQERNRKIAPTADSAGMPGGSPGRFLQAWASAFWYRLATEAGTSGWLSKVAGTARLELIS